MNTAFQGNSESSPSSYWKPRENAFRTQRNHQLSLDRLSVKHQPPALIAVLHQHNYA